MENAKKPNWVCEIMLQVERDGVSSLHSLYFDGLSLNEMCSNGFCGPLEFEDGHGTTVVAELDAAPSGRRDEGTIRRFIFSLTYPDGRPFPAQVTRMNYKLWSTPVRVYRKRI